MSFIYEPKADWINESHCARLLKRSAVQNIHELRSKAASETEWFWKDLLQDAKIEFRQQYSSLLTGGLPWPKWAVNGKLSVVEHCIDRHPQDKQAVVFESDEPGKTQTWTYGDLKRESTYIAELLHQKGAKAGDRIALVMPMSLEMLACFFGVLRAKMTVIPIFSGYGPEAIQARLQDAEVKFVFVQEKTTRRAKEVPVLEKVKSLAANCPSLKEVIVTKREEFWSGDHQPESELDGVYGSEDECMLLYTSGTTGKPKACVHTPFGVLATTAKEHRYAFDVKAEDTFFWYTDIGWMMGPWELFGALQAGAKVVLFEGVPDFPTPDRIWKILEEHKVSQFGISPTAVRVLKKSDSDFLKSLDLTHLRILGSTGEPWDEDSWTWFFNNVGKSRCPIINISGGTEVMGCLLSPTPLDPLKPTTLAGPALGVNAQIWNEDGQQIKEGIGHLVCLSPLPSMTKGFLNNPQRYLDTYFSKFGENVWFHGDWALQDEDGAWFLKGRSDDTIKVAGKRVGPNEYESALMEDQRVLEVAAVGVPHEVKGEGVHCFVVLKNSADQSDQIISDLMDKISSKMGKALKPERIIFAPALPKTRSGKILRSIIRKISMGEDVDDSAVEDPRVLTQIKKAV